MQNQRPGHKKFLISLDLLLGCLILQGCHLDAIDCGPGIYNLHIGSIQWNPKGNNLAFLKDEYIVYSSLVCYKNHFYDVFLADSSGIPYRTLTRADRIQFEHLKWSPVGDRIAYVNTTSYFWIGVLDTFGHSIYFDKTFFVGDVTLDLDWSPDGSQIIILGQKYGNPRPQLYIVSVADGQSHVFQDTLHERMNAVSWSSTNSIAFEFGANRKYVVAISEPDESGLQVLDTVDVGQPILAWFKDGRHLLYTEGSPSSNGMRFVIYDVSTNQKEHIIETGYSYIASVRCSPDDKRICYSTIGGLFLIDLDGPNTSLISSKSIDCSWSPDGKKIVYVEYHEKVDSLRFRQFEP